MIFHITEPVLERNPYVKSTVPVWAEATEEMERPQEEPRIPYKADLCCLVKVVNPKPTMTGDGLYIYNIHQYAYT